MTVVANLRFGNFNSYQDYLLHISELEVGQPELHTRYIDIPFRNGSLDFTDIYGLSSFSDRFINVTFQTSIISQLKTDEIYAMYDSIIADIYGTGTDEIQIDNIEGVFIGRVVSVSPVSLFEHGGQIQVQFRCNPFRISKEYVGCNDIWDTFYPFNQHVFSDCMHDNVTSEIDARLFNNSVIPIHPVIVVMDAPVTVTQGNVSKTYDVGTHDDTHVLMKPMTWTDISINSNGGSIRFKWKRIFI